MPRISDDEMISLVERSRSAGIGLLLPPDEIIRLIPRSQEFYQFAGIEPYQLIRLEEIIEDEEGPIEHIVTLRGTMMEAEGETLQFPAWSREGKGYWRPEIGEEHWVSSRTVAAAYYLLKGVGDEDELKDVLMTASIYPGFTSFIFQKRVTFQGFIAGNHVIRR